MSHRRATVRSIPLGRAAAIALGAAVVPAGALALGAGGAASHATTARVIASAQSAKYGKILVSGHTLYTLKASATPCGATCLSYWPAVLLPKGVAHASAGAGVSAAKLGTAKLGAHLQVTYAGKRLYWFSLDTAKGQVKGNVTDTWGKWSVVVLAKPHAAPTTTTTAKAGATTTTVHATTTTTTTTTVPSGGGGGGAGF